MEELKQQIAVLMDKCYGPERHHLHRVMEELPYMADEILSKTRIDVQRWHWDVEVRVAIWKMVERYRYEKGKLPLAILAGREVYEALCGDRGARLTIDALAYYWRDILIVRITDSCTAYLIGEAIPVQIPPYPGK